MATHALIDAVRLAYPQIWFACHVEHRTRSHDRETGLTDREAGILAHINISTASGCPATDLARHLGIGKSALSQHLKRMGSLGLISFCVDSHDRRRRLVTLTSAGQKAVADASPLDAQLLERLLELVPIQERAQAVHGLQLLADAARRLRDGRRRSVK